MKTPTDILNERNAERSSGRLAHTPNGYGEFYARSSCPCYTCRDSLDPTGEEDAKLHNETLSFAIPPPPPTPPLMRQNAICVCCEAGHDSEAECTVEPLRPLLLPRPPHLTRQPSLGSPTSVMSSLIGIQTPRSVSDPLSIEEQTHHMEMKLQPRLCKLLHSYQKLQEHIEQLNADPSLSHDEMAAYDTWWTEVDSKIATLESLIAQMPE